MFTQPDISEPNKLIVSQKYLLTIFHFFGLHPFFERKTINLNRILNYIPSLVVLCFNVILIVLNIIEFFEKTLTVASMIKIWHLIVWNATTAYILIKTIMNPIKFVQLLESMSKVDDILLKRLKHETNYERIRWTYGLKLATISSIYVALLMPYYIYNYKHFDFKIMCFEISSDLYGTILLAFFLFYFAMLNDRVKIAHDYIQKMTRKIKVRSRNKHERDMNLIANLTTLKDVYGKLWSITLTINENFGPYLISFIIFTFIDIVALTFFLCKQPEGSELASSISSFCLLLGSFFHLLIVAIVTNDLKENANGIGNSIHLFDASDENDQDFIILIKDFSSHVLFQPIVIESVFFQFDLEILVPVRDDFNEFQ